MQIQKTIDMTTLQTELIAIIQTIDLLEAHIKQLRLAAQQAQETLRK